MKLLRSALVAAFIGTLLITAGCGSVFDSIFGDGDDQPPPGDDPSNPFFGGGDGGNGEGSKPCTGLCLRQKACANGGTTSLSGQVFDPAGKVPLYNVLVYVPNAPVAPITPGAICDRCGSVSGDPLVTTITGVDGKFKLDNVPIGADIPLVVQIGKWRRQLLLPNVAECVDTPLAKDQIRLPGKKSEGDLPQIALTTGGADVMECWLRKVGVADEEFTTNTGNGKVHFYGGVGGANSNPVQKFAPAYNGGANFATAQSFWVSKDNLAKYDIVIMSCEGITSPGTKPAEALRAMHEYANLGGRIFASHWHRFWFSTAARVGSSSGEPAGQIPSPFEPFATWNDRNDPPVTGNPGTAPGTINTSFPKGQAMHDWLGQPLVNALTNDKLMIQEPKHNTDAPTLATATTWITAPGVGPQQAVEYLSFNTPIPAPDNQKCGRVVYSDLHVSRGGVTPDGWGPWPSGCAGGGGPPPDLTPQEKALEFMLFDLSSCIQSDKDPPTAPATGVK